MHKIKTEEHFHWRPHAGLLGGEDSQHLTAASYARYPRAEGGKIDENGLPYFSLRREEGGQYRCQTHYYIGLDWVTPAHVISVVPKIEHIDYLTMLFQALEEPENETHLEGLCEIDFTQAMIPIPQTQDELSLFLIIEYVQILRHLVKKGLKKKYYTEEKVYRGRIKGKIAVVKSLHHQLNKHTMTEHVCQSQEFGLNHDENRLLKQALLFSERYLEKYPSVYSAALECRLNMIRTAFKGVDAHVSIDFMRSFKPNPFYKDYERALVIAQSILKRFSYHAVSQPEALMPTPPYWINMAQLFELYVFKKLREAFSEPKAIQYHLKANRQELDFLLNTKGKAGEVVKKVIDAKYKPAYQNKGIGMEDARQLAGYTRLKTIYQALSVPAHTVIDALVIYPDKHSGFEICLDQAVADPHYVQLEKLGLRLPTMKTDGF